MQQPVGLYVPPPSPRGKFLGWLGAAVVLGFVVIVGMLMSAVAQSQTVKDPREKGSPLDVQSVTLKHDVDHLVATVRFYEPVSLTRLTGGGKLWVSLQPGGDNYYVMEMTKGTHGLISTLTRCNADRCAYEEATKIKGKRVNKHMFRMRVDRSALAGLGDRLEWQAGSVFGGNRHDQVPNEGLKVHHF